MLPRASFADLAGDGRADGKVLDVRRSLEWAGGHLSGARHIPLQELSARLDEVPDREVWVHCRSGYRATTAASMLARAGRRAVLVDEDFSSASTAGLALTAPARPAQGWPEPVVLLLALPVGVLIGLSLGALGGGGSILTVPALVYLLDQSPHGATTASLIIVGTTALVGMVVHLKAGRVQVRSGLVFGVLGAGGSYVGSRLSASVDPNLLLGAFSLLIVGVAAAVCSAGAATTPELAWRAATTGGRRRRGSRAGGPARRSHRSARWGRDRSHRQAARSPLRVVVAASVVGLLTGFFGVGGGFVVVPALVLVLGFDMSTAVGTSLLVIAVNSASALLSRLSTHAHVDVAMLVVFTAAAIVGTVAGSHVASRTKPERLVGAFAMLLIAVAAYTAARSVPHLV